MKITMDMTPEQVREAYLQDPAGFEEQLYSPEFAPGHMAIALKDGRVLFGYHPENFRVLSREET